jgi:hypothetical protein
MIVYDISVSGKENCIWRYDSDIDKWNRSTLHQSFSSSKPRLQMKESRLFGILFLFFWSKLTYVEDYYYLTMSSHLTSYFKSKYTLSELASSTLTISTTSRKRENKSKNPLTLSHTKGPDANMRERSIQGNSLRERINRRLKQRKYHWQYRYLCPKRGSPPWEIKLYKKNAFCFWLSWAGSLLEKDYPNLEESSKNIERWVWGETAKGAYIKKIAFFIAAEIEGEERDGRLYFQTKTQQIPLLLMLWYCELSLLMFF